MVWYEWKMRCVTVPRHLPIHNQMPFSAALQKDGRRCSTSSTAQSFSLSIAVELVNFECISWHTHGTQILYMHITSMAMRIKCTVWNANRGKERERERNVKNEHVNILFAHNNFRFLILRIIAICLCVCASSCATCAITQEYTSGMALLINKYIVNKSYNVKII